MSNWRENFLLIGLLILCGLLISRLFYLQIEKGEYYKAMAKGQQNIIQEIQGKRGDIYFKSGKKILAITDEDPYLFFSPEEIEDGLEDSICDEISEIVEIDKEDLLGKAKVEGSYYQIIKKHLTDNEVEEIAEVNKKGIYIGKEQKRYYPGKSTSSQLCGFINQEGKGQYGLEGYYNDVLSGNSKIVKQTRSPWGFLSAGSESNKGANIYLTIDYNIQFMAERILDEGIETYGAKSGSIIVLNPNTGEIMAMAEGPRFDLNNFNTVEDYSIYQSSSTQLLFEPGSIFKAITMAASLNEGAVTPETEFNDSVGCKRFTDYTVCNYDNRAYGEVTMSEVLEHSINTGIMFAEEELGHDKFYKYFTDFGFMDDSGIDFPNNYSTNRNLREALDIGIEVAFGNASFGQGVLVTPLHIIKAYSGLINGGDIMKPYLVEKIVYEDNTEKVFTPEIYKKGIISNKTSTDLVKMLIGVVENGYDKRAHIDGYYIGGKTGTSQISYSSLGINKAGYSDETWQTFIGFAPAYNPEFIILVKLDSPTETTTSGYSAAPMFKQLAKYILDYLKIPFDYSLEEDVTN